MLRPTQTIYPKIYLPRIVACKFAQKCQILQRFKLQLFDSETGKTLKIQIKKVSYLHGVTNDEKYIVISGTIGVHIPVKLK